MGQLLVSSYKWHIGWTGRVLTPSKPLETLGIDYFFYCIHTNKNAPDGFEKSDGFQEFPPCLKILDVEEVFKQ